MIYLTDSQNIIEFENKQQALEHISNEIKRYRLGFIKVYDHTENNIQVIIYQFKGIYLKTYILQEK